MYLIFREVIGQLLKDKDYKQNVGVTQVVSMEVIYYVLEELVKILIYLLTFIK